jgi:membrane protease YdiL (CAAX protease family)
MTRIFSIVMVRAFPAGEGTWVWWVRYGTVVVISWTLAVWINRRYTDKRSFESLGLTFDGLAVKDFFVGLILSGLMVGIVFTILLISGLLEVQEISWADGGIPPILEILLFFLGIGLAVAWSEELLFRGYLLQNLRDGIGIVWAVAIMSIYYGIVHMSNPNSTWLAGVIISIFGFLRIFPWLRTGQLWLGMGMHAGWNFFQGPIFGFGVSGYSTETLIKQNVLGGPDWITGGSFGPEAGIVVLPALLLGLVAVYLWTVKREHNLLRNPL